MDAELEVGSETKETKNVFIAPDNLPEGLKPGDKLSLTLVGQDASGKMEFSCEHGEDEGPKDFRDDLRQNVEEY